MEKLSYILSAMAIVAVLIELFCKNMKNSSKVKGYKSKVLPIVAFCQISRYDYSN